MSRKGTKTAGSTWFREHITLSTEKELAMVRLMTKMISPFAPSLVSLDSTHLCTYPPQMRPSASIISKKK